MKIQNCCECGKIYIRDYMYSIENEGYNEYTCKNCMLKEINEMADVVPVSEVVINGDIDQDDFIEIHGRYFLFDDMTEEFIYKLDDDKRKEIADKKEEREIEDQLAEAHRIKMAPEYARIKKQMGLPEDESTWTIGQCISYNLSCMSHPFNINPIYGEEKSNLLHKLADTDLDKPIE